MSDRADKGSGGNDNYDSERELTLAEFLIPVLRGRYIIAAVAIFAAVVGGLTAVGREVSYTSSMILIPDGASHRSNVVGLANQFGLQLATADATSSPQFYVQLLESRALLGQLVSDTFEIVEQTKEGRRLRRGSLSSLVESDTSGDRALLRKRVVSWLESAVDAGTTPTGMVEVTVTSPWADLSHGLGLRLIQLVNEFDVETRQSRAAVERRFIEERLSQAENDLITAENSLKEFLEANRQFENSPQLIFEFDRHQRQVDLHHQRVMELRRSLEEAKVAELRDMPVVTVFEPPERPLGPDHGTGLRTRLLLGFAAGLLFALVFVFAREFIRYRSASRASELTELSEAWKDVLRDFEKIRSWHRSGRRRVSDQDAPVSPEEPTRRLD